MTNKQHKDHPTLVQSFRYAWCGIVTACTEERNIKIMFVIGVLSLILGWILQITYYDWCILILLNGGMIFSELINTAVETVVDLASPEIHPLAKRAKDIAAGAGLVYACMSVILGIMIYGKALYVLLGR